MGRLRSGGLWSGLAIILLLSAVGCGGHTPPRVSPFPATVSISPATTTSLQLGNILPFTASVRNGSNQVVNQSIAFVSSDTSILNISPGGIACAGHWDSTFSICTPGGVGLVQVSALAGGTSSAPTLVFVHAPIDNIVVTGILPANQTVQEPCLSQSQTMTLQ